MEKKSFQKKEGKKKKKKKREGSSLKVEHVTKRMKKKRVAFSNLENG